MKKHLLLFLLLIAVAKITIANHTKGGWMYYEYLGPGSTAGTAKYHIVLKVYTICELSSGQFNPDINFSVFNGGNNQFLYNIPVSYTDQPNTQNCILQECHPCISPIPSICYKIITYETVQEFPVTSTGYTIAYQRCCRITGLSNIQAPSSSIGETWTVTIPGTGVAPGAETNSSAKFSQNDTAIICANNYFTFDFSAVDGNNDSLSYAFTSAYQGGDNLANSAPSTSSPPPFYTVPYSGGYSGSQPLGSGVNIDHKTGIVSGIAPASGEYVVTVVCSEYRRGTGIKIAEVRKSLHIKVADCNLTQAKLNPSYVNCTDFTVNFINNASSNNIQTFDWEFGDGATSTLPAPSHTYAAAGNYTVKLVVNRNMPCSDSSTSPVKVFPGFFPDFTVTGQCKNTPILFKDITTATYGSVNSWQWNFGDLFSASNTANTATATHTYGTSNNYDVTLIVSTSVGCIDTLLKTVLVTDKPALTMPHDTTICTIDTLQLTAIGDGTFLWSPNYMISNINIPSPLVSPDITTVYKVRLTDPYGCVGTDSVKITVVDHVNLAMPSDSTICRTDGTVLNVVSDGLYYQWTENPAGNTLSNPKIKNPVATPVAGTTTYHLVSSIGKCIAQGNTIIKTVPYPNANAGPDQTICIGQSTQLHATGGSSYTWSPAAFLNNRLIPDPLVQNPTASIKYVVTVTDNLGCPKAVRDSILVTVAHVVADAGPSDTSVVLGQPLLLHATGGTHYLWSPAQWLTNIGSATPVALPQSDITYFVQVSNDAGCTDKDSIRVHLFRLDAGIYVPSAFSPNGDGVNDYFRPILIGMQSLDVFRVYDRWGVMVYSGTDYRTGWDGTFGGKGQDPATYVWYAEGTDYKNNKIKKKGYVVLIR